MNIILSNGLQKPVIVSENTEVGHIRTLTADLQELGVPSAYSFAINAVGVEDNHVLSEGDVVTFRPKTGEKGHVNPL